MPRCDKMIATSISAFFPICDFAQNTINVHEPLERKGLVISMNYIFLSVICKFFFLPNMAPKTDHKQKLNNNREIMLHHEVKEIYPKEKFKLNIPKSFSSRFHY